MYVDGGQSLYTQLFEIPGERPRNECLCAFSCSGFQNSSRYLRDESFFFFFLLLVEHHKNVQNIYSHHMIFKGSVPSAANI